MEILKGFFDKLHSKPIYLNHSRGKSLQVCVDPASLPNITPVFRLNDHNHDCNITFSKGTMDLISSKYSLILSRLREEEETLFFINDELKVFSECMHNKCAVCFLNVQGVRINMMSDTFRKMINSSTEISAMHSRLQEKVNDTSKNLKQLLNILLDKYTQCNVENPEFQGFLQQLHQCANSFVQGGSTLNTSNQTVNTSNTSNDNDDEFEDDDNYSDDDDYYHDYDDRRQRRYNDYDEYDDDEDEFDSMEYF